MDHNAQTLLPQITHDLRNYINGISGLANIISENIDAYQKKQAARGAGLDDNLKEISECAHMLAPYSNEALVYVEDILNSEQNKTNKFSLGTLEDCNVGELVVDLLIFNKSFISDNGVVIETEIEENLPKLRCDILRLKQILNNLITNAVKFSFEGGKVKISVNSLHKNDKKQIYIKISDTGIGMSEAEVKMALSGEGKNINKSNLNKPINSHGLGMPIVKQLIELLGAKMEIKSEKGKGTKISLYFNCN